MKSFKSKKVNELLLHEWDPIGVIGIKGAEDEYAQYVRDILEIIQNSSSSEELFRYLWELETEYMGLKGNKKKTESFSKLLFHEIKSINDLEK
jgi:sugar diacid utilization regulator